MGIYLLGSIKKKHGISHSPALDVRTIFFVFLRVSVPKNPWMHVRCGHLAALYVEMYGMFDRTLAFNGDVSQWNTSQVTNMSFMFSETESFNGDVSRWSISQVTDMSFMFNEASAFNSDLSNWNTSRVTDMYAMFNKAHAFNSDLSN